jgi:hypothetical protein
LTLQSASPWSAMYAKPGWVEDLGPHRFRIMFSHEEVRILVAKCEPAPAANAYVDAVLSLLERHGVEAGPVELDLPVRGQYARGVIAEAE